MIVIPDLLKKAEFSLLKFSLEFQEPFTVTKEVILRLRRELRFAERQFAESRVDDIHSLFNPCMPFDPVALKRYQKGAPPFIILPPEDLPCALEPGDIFVLPVVFIGRGTQYAGTFINVFRLLGAYGIFNGAGLFELVSVVADDPSGNPQQLWEDGEDPMNLPLPLIDLAWWINVDRALPESIRLRFLTPARLLTHGRPVFRPTFRAIFSFLLRRVTSMLYIHCGIELVQDPREQVDSAAMLLEFDNRLLWEDWKKLDGDYGALDLGGVGGTISLGGNALAHLYWILKLGTLLNLGKGAAYGAGHYIVEDI